MTCHRRGGLSSEKNENDYFEWLGTSHEYEESAPEARTEGRAADVTYRAATQSETPAKYGKLNLLRIKLLSSRGG
ncbi:MAG: hypothetical protein WBP60_07490 [Gammaproteobacteria bacterium]